MCSPRFHRKSRRGSPGGRSEACGEVLGEASLPSLGSAKMCKNGAGRWWNRTTGSEPDPSDSRFDPPPEGSNFQVLLRLSNFQIQIQDVPRISVQMTANWRWQFTVRKRPPLAPNTLYPARLSRWRQSSSTSFGRPVFIHKKHSIRDPTLD